MKTKLTFVCLLFSATLMAQVNNLPTTLNIDRESAFGVVPSSLSYDGSNRVYVRTDDNQVAIYSNAFTPVKSFNITPTLQGDEVINMVRTVTVSVTGGELISENIVVWDGDLSLIEINGDYNVPSTWGETEIKNFLETNREEYAGLGFNGTITEIKPQPNGGTWFIYDMDAYTIDGRDTYNYWEVETYGKQYPKSAFLWRKGYLYYEYNIGYTDQSTYSDRQVSYSYSEWSETGRTSHEYAKRGGLPFIDYDIDQVIYDEASGDGLCLTQTLFNTDDKYEYLSFPVSRSEMMEGNSPNEPICDNCYNDGETFTESKSYFSLPIYNGFNVMSEDGNTLQSVSFPNGFQMRESVSAQIIKLEDEYYLICTGEMGDYAALLIYKINRSKVGAAIQQVSEPQRISGAYKVLHKGNVYIINDDHTYTITGQKVK